MLDKFKYRWHVWRQHRELHLAKKGEAPGLYQIMLDGVQPLDWLLYEGRISQVAYTLAYEWLAKGYLCERVPPENPMYEHRGFGLWVELTVLGRRVLKRRYGGV